MKLKPWIPKVLFWLAIFVLLTPITIFTINFSSQSVSSSIADWGTFGDFFGGVTNTIVSILSLIILTYISVVVSKFSSEENKNLFILQKQIEAFDEFAKYIPRMNMIGKEIAKKLSRINFIAQKKDITNLDQIEMLLEAVYTDVMFVHEYHYYLFNFNARYSHIFKYNFEKEKYLNLISTSKNFSNAMDTFYNDLSTGKDLTNDIQAIFDKHLPFLVDFVNDLKEEIEQKTPANTA